MANPNPTPLTRESCVKGGRASGTLAADWMVAERYEKLEREGKSAREIAEILHVSERTVVRWRSKT